MKLQNLTVIFIIIILPIILLLSLYISSGLKTIKYQALYDDGIITATQDAIQAYEINSLKNKYSDNAEIKRSIIKSSVKMLEQSLCNTCNISSYNVNEIEEYIPAVLFGMRNGFYLYSPSDDGNNQHSLKNYVYYSEEINSDTSGKKAEGAIIIYHLDSYIEVSGWFKDVYESKEGYLINSGEVEFFISSSKCDSEAFYEAYMGEVARGNTLITNDYKITYYGTNIDTADSLAVSYFVDNYIFSEWFKNNIDLNKYTYLNVWNTTTTNDPEDPESAFSMHKKEVIRNKIQNVLNSTITAYSRRTYGQEYKMPKLSEEDWEKIYTDVSVITFFQGKKIGFTTYNGYCVLNSNNNYELINPNLLYFSTDDSGDYNINTTEDYYHDIRCNTIASLTPTQIKQGTGLTNITTLRGWKIGRFKKKDLSDPDEPYGYNATTGKIETVNYGWERLECACYDCINGSNIANLTVYDYIKVATTGSSTTSATDFLKESYWTSLARERAKLTLDQQIETSIEVTKTASSSIVTTSNPNVKYTIEIKNNTIKEEYIRIMDYAVGSDIINVSKTSFPISLALGPTATATITYDGTLSDGNNDGVVTNRVEVYVDATMECYAEETVKVEKSSLAIAMTASKSTVPSGTEVEYTITVNNKASIPDTVTIESDFITGGIPKVWENVNVPGNGTITLTHKQTVSGNTGEEITNTAEITKSSIAGGSSPGKKAQATVKIANTDLTVEKEVSSEKVHYGDSVTYTITITNNASIDDKIKITDTFDSSKIKNISNLKVNGISTISVGTSGGFTISDIAISASGGKVEITYDAKIYGNIGEKIENKVTVESTLSGTSEDIAKTTVIDTEVETELAASVDAQNIILAFDVSNSLILDGYETYIDVCTGFVEDVKNMCDSHDELNLVGGYVLAETAYGMYGGDTLCNEWPYRLRLGTGTNYKSVLKNIYDFLKNRNEEYRRNTTIIFFSDGYPTLGWVDVKYPGSTTGGRSVWSDIIDYTDDLKDWGVTICCLGYKGANGDGLRIMASNGRYYNSNNLSTLFETVFKSIFPEIDDQGTIETAGGVIESLKYVDKISKIEVGSTVYEGASLTSFLSSRLKNIKAVTEGGKTYQTGSLDLTGISAEHKVKITFK